MRVEIWTDGAAYKVKGPTSDKPRRGHAGAGFVILGDAVLCEGRLPLGFATNNEAEYRAIIRALEVARHMGATTAIVRTDSDLVYGQIDGANKCRAPHLKPLRERVLTERDLFQGNVTFACIDRTLNAEADSLANQAKEMSLAGVSEEELATSPIANPS
jgi:ribonuclease HI